MKFSSIFSTPFGCGVVQASEQGIVRVELPDMTNKSACIRLDAGYESSLLTEHASALLNRYFSGEVVEFNDIEVDLSGSPPFRDKALRAIRAIPYGEVRSYGQIAAECGSPRAARAVGGAMASNPVPVIIPCHRIVGSNGCLTGFSAPGGEEVKMLLLKMEGVEFKGMLVCRNKRVMNSFSYHE